MINFYNLHKKLHPESHSKKTFLFLLMFCMVIFMFNFSSSLYWNNETFNNSLTEEDVLLYEDTGFEGIRWLSVPENTIVTNAFLNITGKNLINVSELPGGSSVYYLLTNDLRIVAQKINVSMYVDKLGFSWRCQTTCDGNISYQIRNSTNHILAECDAGSANNNVFYKKYCDISPDLEITGDNYISIKRKGSSTGTVWALFENEAPALLGKDLALGAFYRTTNNGTTWEIWNDDTYGNGTSEVIVDIINSNITLNPFIKIGNEKIWNYTGEYTSEETTINLANIINNYISSATPVGGNYFIPFLFNSSSIGKLEYSSMSFNNTGFLLNEEIYNESVYESDLERFALNITYDYNEYTAIEGILNYDGTNYTAESVCVNENCIISATIDIPLLSSGNSENKSFYWIVTQYNGTNVEKTKTIQRQQNISSIHFEYCDTYTNNSLIFNAAEEINLTSINSFSFNGFFSFWLGSGNIKKTYNYSNSSANSIEFCISPDSKNYHIDGDIEFSSTGYNKRTYHFYNYSINSSEETITLLLLSSSVSTTFIQEVLETSTGVEDAYIYTYRYYPGTNEWKLTQVTRTDSNGKSSAFYEAETATYRHTIVVDGITRIEETNGRKMLLESVPYTITWNLDSPIDTPWEIFDDESGISWSLSYNKNTKIVTFTYTGNSTYLNGNLTIWKEYYSQDDKIVCTSSSTLSVATISCNVSGYEGNFIATGYVEYNGKTILLDSIRFSIGKGKDVFGNAGIILGWLIILVAGTSFLIHPIIGIVAINIAIIFTNIIGLISFDMTYIFATLAVSGILIWLMKD